MAKKKGKGKGKKAPKIPSTMAVGSALQSPSNVLLWRNAPPLHRVPPPLAPVHRAAPPVPHRPAPMVAFASGGESSASLINFLASGGSVDAPVDIAATPAGTLRACSLLMLASTRGDLALVETLMRRGADADAPHAGTGLTALMLAAASGRVAVLACLLKAGVRADRRDHEGRSAIDLAEAGEHDVAAQVLHAHQQAVAATQVDALPAAIASAALNGDNLGVVTWAECGGAVDAPRPTDGSTLLMLASENGNATLVEALLQLGARRDLQRTSDAHTALMIAAFHGHRTVVRSLVQARSHRAAPAPPMPSSRPPPSPPMMAPASHTLPSGVPEYAMQFRLRYDKIERERERRLRAQRAAVSQLIAETPQPLS